MKQRLFVGMASPYKIPFIVEKDLVPEQEFFDPGLIIGAQWRVDRAGKDVVTWPCVITFSDSRSVAGEYLLQANDLQFAGTYTFQLFIWSSSQAQSIFCHPFIERIERVFP